jgi:hypothetical protein
VWMMEMLESIHLDGSDTKTIEEEIEG